MPSPDPASRFAARARLEAARYGSDPWVFVRELVQNARDAGATRVDWSATSSPGEGTWLACDDDGSGMAWEHARRYLFRLYATTKRGRSGEAGRFGVGFWSVLGAAPLSILVASRPRRGTPWAIRLSGDLSRAERVAAPQGPGTGTRVALEMTGDSARARAAVAAALRRYVRGLRRLHGDEPLDIHLDGAPVDSRLGLPEPAVGFSTRSGRGVVGLGRQPRVELFSHGLLVRSASVLDELLGDEPRTAGFDVAPGLAPCALIDAPGLEPLLSRGDVRPDRRLVRAVDGARRATQRLIRDQLDRLRPRTPRERFSEALGAMPGLAIAALLAGTAALVGGVLAALLVAPPPVPPAGAPTPAPSARAGAIAPRPAARLPTAEAAPSADARVLPGPGYRDLRSTYEGPAVHEESHAAWPLRLEFLPASPPLHFAVLVRRPMEEGLVRPTTLHPLPAARCEQDCTQVSVAIDAEGGLLPLPRPTGHRVDQASVRLDAAPLAVLHDADGMPHAVLPAPARGSLTYVTWPAADPTLSDPALSVERLPAELADLAKGLTGRPASEAAALGSAWLAERLEQPLDVARHARAQAAGRDFQATALELRSGDCDVRNAILARVLSAAGVEARLAVGFRGAGGSVRPWLHAWVEFRDGPETPWSVADASLEPVAEPAPPEALARVAIARPTSGSRSAGRFVLGGALGMLALAPLLLWWHRRSPTPAMAPGADLTKLLRGALAHPEAWRDAPEVFDRRLLPRVDGGRESLRAAWTAAADGRLCCAGAATTALARRALRAGMVVLESGHPEVGLVADTLGAHDLDAWERAVQQLARARVVDEACEALRRAGLALSARIGGSRIERLSLARRRGGGARHWVLLPADTPWLRTAQQLWPARPATARLLAADGLLETLALEGEDAIPLLSDLARAALRERPS